MKAPAAMTKANIILRILNDLLSRSDKGSTAALLPITYRRFVVLSLSSSSRRGFTALGTKLPCTTATIVSTSAGIGGHADSRSYESPSGQSKHHFTHSQSAPFSF